MTSPECSASPSPTPDSICRSASTARVVCGGPRHHSAAGTELLIRHAAWLHRGDFRDRFVHPDTAITGDTDMVTIDWPAAITALDAGQLSCSGGERWMLRLAASLADGIPVNLRDALTGLDSTIDLVGQAVRHINRRP